MNAISTFWWSPANDPQLLRRELQRNFRTWWRLSLKHRRRPTNFGDELSPMLLGALTGRRTRWAPASSASLIAVGSIIEYTSTRARARPAVWGAGLRNNLRSPAEAQTIRTNLGEVLAVRGPHTRDALGLDASTVLGDPGLLVASVRPRGRAKRSGGIYIPHFRSWSTRSGVMQLRQASAAGLSIVPPSRPADEVLEAISRADVVFSSSLHGIICAHAYGTPVLRVGIPGGGSEPDFKYLDYLSSVDLKQGIRTLSPEEMLDIGDDVIDEAAMVAAHAEARGGELADRLISVLEHYA